MLQRNKFSACIFTEHVKYLVCSCHLGDQISTWEVLMWWESKSYSVYCHVSLQPFDCVAGCSSLALVLQLVTQTRTNQCSSGGCRRGGGGGVWRFFPNHQTTPKQTDTFQFWLVPHHQELCPALDLPKSSPVGLGCSETSLHLFHFICPVSHRLRSYD